MINFSHLLTIIYLSFRTNNQVENRQQMLFEYRFMLMLE